MANFVVVLTFDYFVCPPQYVVIKFMWFRYYVGTWKVHSLFRVSFNFQPLEKEWFGRRLILFFLLSSLSSTSMAGDFLVNKNKTWGANSYFEQELLDYLRVTICDEIIKSFYHLATLFKLNRVDNPFLRFANLFYMFLRCADEFVCFFSSIETSIP